MALKTCHSLLHIRHLFSHERAPIDCLSLLTKVLLQKISIPSSSGCFSSTPLFPPPHWKFLSVILSYLNFPPNPPFQNFQWPSTGYEYFLVQHHLLLYSYLLSHWFAIWYNYFKWCTYPFEHCLQSGKKESLIGRKINWNAGSHSKPHKRTCTVQRTYCRHGRNNIWWQENPLLMIFWWYKWECAEMLIWCHKCYY